MELFSFSLFHNVASFCRSFHLLLLDYNLICFLDSFLFFHGPVFYFNSVWNDHFLSFSNSRKSNNIWQIVTIIKKFFGPMILTNVPLIPLFSSCLLYYLIAFLDSEESCSIWFCHLFQVWFCHLFQVLYGVYYYSITKKSRTASWYSSKCLKIYKKISYFTLSYFILFCCLKM